MNNTPNSPKIINKYIGNYFIKKSETSIYIFVYLY